MRPGQNKRMRGRPNNNRRGPNPLTRSYESNGPDVKIRGNAHHVAEKYLQLARDAHTSSDPVAAENYLQHAEHYFRLIASAQAAQLQQQNGSARPPGEGDADEMDDDDDVGGLSDRFASPAERAPPPFQPQSGFSQPALPQPQPQSQPYQDRAPYENDRQPPSDRGYQGRQDRPNNRQENRGPRDNRPYQDRQDQQRDNRDRDSRDRDPRDRDPRDNRFPRDNRPREFRPYRDPNPPRETANPSEAPALAPVLPSFITAPPRVNAPSDVEETQFSAADQPPRIETETPPADDAAPFVNGEGEPRFPARGRRRRPRPTFGFNAPGDSQAADSSEQPPHKDEAPAGD
jgi:Domain of unknown function (DUF4167)